MDKIKEERLYKDFKTSDIILVAFLRYNSQVVKSIKKVSDSKAEFVFDIINSKLIDSFNTGDSNVEPVLFSNIMRQQLQAARRVIKE